MNIKGKTEDHSITTHNTTNTGTSGKTSRLGGVEDFRGVLNYSIDLDSAPWNTNLKIGVSGVLDFYQSPTVVNKFAVIIEKTHGESAVGTELVGSVEVSMNCIQNGVFTDYQLGAAAS